MLKQLVRVGDLVFDRFTLDDAICQDALSRSRSMHSRAVCLCREDGVEMYVSLRGGALYLARLPGSAAKHHPTCPSFDVVEEDTDSDRCLLIPAFPLKRHVPSLDLNHKHEPCFAADGGVRSVKTETPTDLRLLLLHLWRSAGLNRWYPAMRGRRNWSLIRYLLQKEALSILLKDVLLSDRLLLPEVFRSSEVESHKTLNIGLLETVLSANASSSFRNLALVIGSIRSFHASKFGSRLQIRHLPEAVFYLDDGLSKKVTDHCSFELMGVGRDSKDEVMAILLVDKTGGGNYVISDCAMMRVSPEWLPLFSNNEKSLVEYLVASGRAFLLPASLSPSPVAYLTDTGEKACPLFIGTSSLIHDDLMEWTWDVLKHRQVTSAPVLPCVAANVAIVR